MRNTFFQSLSKETAVALFFAILALISLSFFFFPEKITKTVTQQVASGQDKITITPTTIPSSVLPQTDKTETIEEEVPETSKTPQTVQITVMITPTPIPAIASDKANVTVEITNNAAFSLNISKGVNQCDVLKQALSENKISQLLMKYDSSLDAYGVYQINTLGKDNAVWWTYTVNGVSPNVGCNHIAANNGDKISWKYIGN